LNGESFFALFFAEELIILVLIKTVEDPIIKHHYILQLVQHFVQTLKSEWGFFTLQKTFSIYS